MRTIPSLRRSLAIINVVALGTALFGCDVNDRRAQQQLQIIQQSEAQTEAYFQADLDHARDCLLSQAKLLEDAVILEPSGRAQLLFMTYCRLYALEKENGDEAAAGANLIKARYWLLCRHEASGIGTIAAMEKVNQYTPERLILEIRAYDKKRNNGTDPQYLRKK